MRHHPLGNERTTRIEAFRLRNSLELDRWLSEADVSPSAFNRFRLGGDMNVDTLARLVRAASKVLDRTVKASELADVGEDEAPSRQMDIARVRPAPHRATYETASDRALLRLGVPLTLLAKEARVTRPTLRKLRQGHGTLRVHTLAAIVRALRRLTGQTIMAGDICDVGEATLPGRDVPR
jgi:hypothetical protein